MQIETVQIKDLILYEKNARTHPKKQIDLLAKNIERFGFTTPCLIDKNNNVIAGHGRIEAIKKLGRNEIPCVRLENLSDDEVKALRIADNKLSEMSEWDMGLVIDELKELSSEMLDLTGFDSDLIISSDEKDDVIPEEPTETQSKLGDLYELGRHRVLCGDSTSNSDVENLMDGHKADMVFTDPPYNVNYEGSNGLKIENDNKSDIDFYTFLLQAYSSYALSMKIGSAIYVCHADLEGLNFRKAFKDAGFDLRSCIIWNKNSLVMGRGDYQWKHEPILYGWRAGGAHEWHGDRKQTTVWDMAKPQKNGEHPTMKPIELIEKAIFNSSKKEDLILDLFLGSGSTLIAAQKTGRICYGMELDPKYVDVIVQRYVDYTGNEEIIKNGETIIWKKTEMKTE